MSAALGDREAPPTADGPRPRVTLRTQSTAPWVAVLCVVLVGIFTALSPDQAFFTGATFRNVVLTASGIVLLCTAQAVLLGAGELDISQGAIVVLSSVLAAKTVVAVTGDTTLSTTTPHLGLAVVAGLAVALATGALVGAINGAFVGGLGLSSLIVTLAMLGIATGAAQVVTNGQDVSGLPIDLQTGFGIRSWAGIPLPAFVVVPMVVVTAVLFARTSFGLHTLAIGSNRSAALRAGLGIRRHVVKLFVLSGMFSGVAGMIELTRFATTNIGGHQTDALAALAGAVIGGTRLTGGRVSLVGAVLGALLAVILQVGLVVVNVQPFYQTIAIGAVLLAAVTIDRLRTRGANP